jgi:hypothetical protein
MISTIKEYVLSNGQKLGIFLESKHSQFRHEWDQTGNVVVFMVYVPGLRSPNIYRWELQGENIYATNGAASELTPELDKRKQEIEERKRAVSVELLRIYNFVKQYHLQEDQPIELVLDKASKEFGLSPGEIEEIYLKVDKILYGKL